LSEDFPVPGGLAPGSLVGGYRVERPLGAGGMALVYQARDERLGRLVALKVLVPALAADEEFRRRFTAESRAAAAVDHPHIIPVYEAGQVGWALFIAMRLVTGGDLRGVLAREGPLSPERAAGFLSPVASALDAAHGAGLVHRDVKPGNVLVDSDPGRPEHVYLSDFGISKGASTAGLTGADQYLGTPEYTSPEQARGLAVDGRADQYALACVAWHLLTGTVPFQRDQGHAVLLAHLTEPPPRLADRRPGLPAASGQVLARAMAKDPGQRYPSCGEFTDALRDALALLPYRPSAAGLAVPGPDAVGHPRTEVSAAPPHPATAISGAASGAGGPTLDQGMPPEADSPTQDSAAPGQSIRPGPGRDGSPPRPVRRRRYLTITLAGTLLAAAAAVPLLLTTQAPPPVRRHADTPTATPTASGGKTEPRALSGPLTGTLSATLTDPRAIQVHVVAFASDGTTLAIGDDNGNTYLWDTATRKLTATLTSPGSQAVYSVAFARGGTTLATGGQGNGTGTGSTYLWDTATRTITATFSPTSKQGVSSVAFAPDGTTLAVGEANGYQYSGSVYLWDTTTDTRTATFDDPHSKGVSSVAFAPDGTTVAVGDYNGSTYLWDIATGKITATLTDPSSGGVMTVAFTPDGTTLAVGDDSGTAYLWRISKLP
jgi:serine/threonine protein kinase